MGRPCIKLADGEPFTSLSSTAAYTEKTKSANGWDFWHFNRGGNGA